MGDVIEFPQGHMRHHHCAECERNHAPARVGLCKPCLDALEKAIARRLDERAAEPGSAP